MKRLSVAWMFAVAIVLSALTSTLHAQQAAPLHAKFRAMPLHESNGASKDFAGAAVAPAATAAAASTIPLWSYSTTASRDGRTYRGKMVGRSPFFHGARTTNINTIMVPVKVTIVTGVGKQKIATVFDPNNTDAACLPNGSATALLLAEQSPILTAANFNMNGVIEADSQYVDAFQRANFFAAVDASGNRYHTPLNLLKIIPASITINAPSGEVFDSSQVVDGCGQLGIVDINVLQKGAEKMLSSLRSKGVGPTNLPIFLFYNVVMNDGPPVDPPNPNRCCTLGFHSGVGSATKAQLFAVADYDSTNAFEGIADAAILSHEVAEFYDDPLVNNGTPSWGNTGQTEGCQNNLEVGDPLTGTLFPAVLMPNGVTYNLQELVFYSWFFGAPSIGAGNLFSDQGTFSSDAGSIC